MAEFELRGKRGRLVAKFDSDVNPQDTALCVDLLRTQARSNGVKPADAELVAKERGRVVKRYRAS